MSEGNLRRNMLWNAAGNLIYVACQWLVTVLVTTLGSFHDAGVLSVAMSITATFRTLALFGIRNFQVSDVDGKYSDSCYVGFRVITCLAALAGCMIFALAADYTAEQLLATLLFMLFHLSENFADVLHGIAQKRDRLDVAGMSFAARGLGLLIVFVAVYRISGNLLLGLLAMTLCTWLVTLLFDLIEVRRLAKFSIALGGKNWLSLAGETAPLCVYLFLNAAIVSAPKLFLERVSGEEILGAYSSIYAPALLIPVVLGYLYNPFAQIFGELCKKRDRAAFLRLTGKLCLAIACVSILIMVVGYFLGEWGLVLIFGEMIRPYVGFFMPILAAMAIVAFFSFFCMLATVLRDFWWLVSACAVGVLLEILLTVPWIRASGINATSYSCILAAAAATLILCGRVLWILLSKQKRRM